MLRYLLTIIAVAIGLVSAACTGTATDTAESSADATGAGSSTTTPETITGPAVTPVLGPPQPMNTATAPMSTTSAGRPLRSLRIIAGGDVLNEGRVNAAAAVEAPGGARFDFTALFAPVAAIIQRADLAICHAELPIGHLEQGAGVYGRSPHGGNQLLAPHELAPGLAAAGFDHCSTASNHSADLGAPGIVSTIEALDAAGLTWAGTARSEGESTARLLEVDDVRVAHLAYTRTDNNDALIHGWMLNRFPTLEEIVDDVTSVRRRGAEIVIVSIHLGTEMSSQPTAGDRRFAHDLLDRADVDLIIHHGPHVVQPYEMINGTPVYWSLGNFISGMGVAGTGRYEDPRALDGLLAQITFDETTPGVFAVEAGAVLICNERGSRTVRAPRVELADPWAVETMPDWLVNEMRACIARTTPVIDEFD